MALDSLKLEAQQAVNELWKEQLVPFKLTVGKIVSDDSSGYTLHFFDSRLRSVSVSCSAVQSFKDQVLAAVKERVARLSGPLGKKKR
jgi:hypothetical protein